MNFTHFPSYLHKLFNPLYRQRKININFLESMSKNYECTLYNFKNLMMYQIYAKIPWNKLHFLYDVTQFSTSLWIIRDFFGFIGIMFVWLSLIFCNEENRSRPPRREVKFYIFLFFNFTFVTQISNLCHV